VSAARDNQVCGVGVAYDSKVAGKQQSFLFSIRDKSKDPISNMANNNRR
jgi:hypothetical protein